MEATRLCPYCLQPLPGAAQSCPHCGKSFAGRNPGGTLPVGTVLVRPVSGSRSGFRQLMTAPVRLPASSFKNSFTVVWYTRGSLPNFAMHSVWP